ncbi:hypothetical protein C0585_00820 [Candidatus Woesearchaeota archaeon]|nr:MAG: hypothetical protein C0585_00820 [Candidatus Woesearchaeota archaeon]
MQRQQYLNNLLSIIQEHTESKKEFNMNLIERCSLPILSVLPSDNIKSEINKTKYPIDDYIESDNIFVDTTISISYVCSETYNYFKKSAFGNDINFLGKDIKLAYINNQFIGILKEAGSHILLAFQTVKNSSGAHPLIKGGLYSVSHRKRGGLDRWAKVNYDNLKVNPLCMMSSIPHYYDILSPLPIFYIDVPDRINKFKERYASLIKP